jgi:hypothetical protein
VDPAMIMSYTIPYFIRPEKLSLKDIWMGMSDEARKEFVDRYNDLSVAIAFLVGGDQE